MFASFVALGAVLFAICVAGLPVDPMNPARGYDTWNGFAKNINETAVLSQAAVLKDLNAKGGSYNYVVLDEGWSHTSNGVTWVLNEQSIPIPSPERFPSSQGNGSLTAFASNLKNNYGLDLGLWLIKGIPKQAVDLKMPIPGPDGKPSNLTAGDIIYSDKRSCSWHHDVYDVDMSKAGAQDYYDGVFELYASWGVKYFKVDCIFGSDLSGTEIVGVHNGVAKAQVTSKSNLILSLSPGFLVGMELAKKYNGYTNSYRISEDMWNCFYGNKYGRECVVNVGAIAATLYPLIGDATTSKWADRRPSFPDMDMVPVGGFNINGWDPISMWEPLSANTTRFCILLWNLAKSPVILSGDLSTIQPGSVVYELLGNPRIAAVHVDSLHPRAIQWDLPPKGKIGQGVWCAESAKNPNSRYVGLFAFNTTLDGHFGPSPVPSSMPSVIVTVSWQALKLAPDAATRTVTDLVTGEVLTSVATAKGLEVPVTVNDAMLLKVDQ